MLRTTRSARRKSAKTFASALALAVAVAGGTVVANGAMATSAMAQEYSPAFIAAYEPVQVVANDPAGNLESVRGQFPAIIAAAQNADEKFVAGQLLYSAGTKLNDQQVQIDGVKLQIESGKMEQEQLLRGYWTLGNLAYDTQDYATARDALQEAVNRGYNTQDPTPLLAESYFQLGENAQGLDVLTNRAQEMYAAGTQVPQEWLLRGLQVAYTDTIAQPAGILAEILVAQHTSPRSWLGALQVVNALGGFSDDARLDLLRLMRLTDSLTDPREYRMYVQAADPRIRASEIDDLLASGVAKGQLSASDSFYTDVKQITGPRLPTERAEATNEAAGADSDPTGETAMIAADLHYSLGDFAEAEGLYAQALDKGGIETQVARTRLGMSQIQQGKFAEAQATLGQVTGPDAVVARLWSAYAETQSA